MIKVGTVPFIIYREILVASTCSRNLYTTNDNVYRFLPLKISQNSRKRQLYDFEN
jgi:hypothetical protein